MLMRGRERKVFQLSLFVLAKADPHRVTKGWKARMIWAQEPVEHITNSALLKLLPFL